MSFFYDFETRNGYVLVQAKGLQSSLNQLLKYVRDIMDVCKNEECNRVLLDERKLTVKTNVFEDYELAVQLFLDRFARQVVRIACVTSEHNKEQTDFFETMAVNRGVNFRSHTSILEAEQWILKEN